MPYEFCSSDFKSEPYWWEQTPRFEETGGELADRTEVLVVGSGYTGLTCALQTAAAGRDTVVIDAEAIGWGCSTRNGGQISGEIKPDLTELSRRFGSETGFAMIREARQALSWLAEFIDTEAIECDFVRSGRYLAAHNPRQFEQLKARAANQPRGLEQELRIVEARDQATEIDSDYYHGGLVIGHHCALDPAKYHDGLLQRVRARGARVIGACRAESIERNSQGFSVVTSQGRIQCRDLVIATNGYTDSLSPWQRRRIIPIGSYMLATEPMAQARADLLMPNRRVFSDTRKLVVYFRRSPDGRRLLFGGRVSVFESDPVKSLPALRAEMLRIMPQLEDLAISHSWMGFVGFSFDNLPHLGVEDGIHYAMGYCGSGICLASYFGDRLGQMLLGTEPRPSVFTRAGFQTRPLYTGNPWFLAPAVRYYQLRDRYL